MYEALVAVCVADTPVARTVRRLAHLGSMSQRDVTKFFQSVGGERGFPSKHFSDYGRSVLRVRNVRDKMRSRTVRVWEWRGPSLDVLTAMLTIDEWNDGWCYWERVLTDERRTVRDMVDAEEWLERLKLSAEPEPCV